MTNIKVIYKKSLYELYNQSADPSVQEFMKTPRDMERLKRSHEAQQLTLEKVIKDLQQREISPRVLYRAELKPITNTDLVITVGGDGTLLEVSHYIKDNTPILGVNSNPESSVGYFSCATKDTFSSILDQLENYTKCKLQRLQLTIDRQKIPELILNDLLIAHRNPAAMTRYEMKVDGNDIMNLKNEKSLRSSGLVVCTAAGSTAWMYEQGGIIMPLSSTQIQYHERDQRNSPFSFANQSIYLRSITREGIIYIDGEHIKYPFALGTSLELTLGIPLTIVGNLEEKRKKYPEKK